MTRVFSHLYISLYSFKSIIDSCKYPFIHCHREFVKKLASAFSSLVVTFEWNFVYHSYGWKKNHTGFHQTVKDVDVFTENHSTIIRLVTICRNKSDKVNRVGHRKQSSTPKNFNTSRINSILIEVCANIVQDI